MLIREWLTTLLLKINCEHGIDFKAIIEEEF